MGVAFNFRSDTTVPVSFGSFTSMERKHEVSTSSGNTKKLARMLEWDFEDEDGCIYGEVPVKYLPRFIEACETAIDEGRAFRFPYAKGQTLHLRLVQLKRLAKAALEAGDPITYG